MKTLLKVKDFLSEKYDLRKELRRWLTLVFSPKGLWIFLPGVLGICFVYMANAQGWKLAIAKGTQETIALWIMGVTTYIFLLRVLLFRSHLDIILLALSTSFFCREIHFYGTHRGVYIAFSIILVWAFFWRDTILSELAKANLLKMFLAGTCWSYFLALVIQRRAFRHILPKEQALHIQLEEVSENIAHLFFLSVGIICYQLIRSSNNRSEKQTDPGA